MDHGRTLTVTEQLQRAIAGLALVITFVIALATIAGGELTTPNDQAGEPTQQQWKLAAEPPSGGRPVEEPPGDRL